MIDPSQFALFSAAALLLAVTPGPGLFYVAARTLAGGRAEGVASSFGTGLGNTSIGMCLGLACGVGLGGLLDAEEKKKRDRRRAERANTDIENVP